MSRASDSAQWYYQGPLRGNALRLVRCKARLQIGGRAPQEGFTAFQLSTLANQASYLSIEIGPAIYLNGWTRQRLKRFRVESIRLRFLDSNVLPSNTISMQQEGYPHGVEGLPAGSTSMPLVRLVSIIMVS